MIITLSTTPVSYTEFPDFQRTIFSSCFDYDGTYDIINQEDCDYIVNSTVEISLQWPLKKFLLKYKTVNIHIATIKNGILNISGIKLMPDNHVLEYIFNESEFIEKYNIKSESGLKICRFAYLT